MAQSTSPSASASRLIDAQESLVRHLGDEARPYRAQPQFLDDADWRITAFRFMLPLGILVCLEQAYLSAESAGRVLALIAALLLSIVSALSWLPKFSAGKWMVRVGDTLTLSAALIGGLTGAYVVLVMNSRTGLDLLVPLTSWLPVIALYVGFVAAEKRLYTLLVPLALLMIVIAAHFKGLSAWGTGILHGSLATYIAQTLIAVGVAWIFSRYRHGLSEAIMQVTQSESVSTTDVLTGMANRRGLLRDLENLHIDPAGGQLMILDIDHFKSINDTYGHNVGDKILVELAILLHHLAPADCRAYRWGGEEFVLLHFGPEADALQFAEQLRSEVERHVFPRRVKVTVSIGLARIHEVEEFHRTFQQADYAMYTAKREGRNRIVNASLRH